MPRKILVTSALPYSNGLIHIGHLAGAYLPADIYVRYQRMAGNDVVFICGADEHGVPITIAAMKQGKTPQELVDKYYKTNRDSFEKFGINFNNFSRTSLPLHHKTSQEFFLALHKKGKLKEKEIKQLFCPEDKMYLADRYVNGICPKCGADDARGDQCEKCGSWLDPLSLKNPKCAICGAEPIVKITKHWYLPMADFQPELETWLKQKKNWKDNVMNYCNGWFKEGLRDRAITRDLDWGIPVPLPDAEGKVMYVWFDAPIGYISSTKEWAEKIGQPDLWKDYWQNPNCELIHFIGKDNIVFHAIFWPATLMEVGGYNLPTQIPANEFLNLEGRKLSTSKNYAVWLPDYLEKFDPDLLRYALAANLPENKDTDFSWKQFQKCNNNELADILGNFVNRTLTFVNKYCDGIIPPAKNISELDSNVLNEVVEISAEAGELIDSFKIRAATAKVMDIARAGNRYFDSAQPWQTRKTDFEACQTTLNICCRLIRTLAICFHPFIPFSSDKIWTMMGLDGNPSDEHWQDVAKEIDLAGIKLGKTEIIFKKIDDEELQPEIDRLEKIVAEMEQKNNVEGITLMPQISFDEFGKTDLRVAKILTAEPVPKTKKLLKLSLSIGTEKKQVVAGIAEFYKPEELPGRKVILVANLVPVKLRGIESQGMILAANAPDGLSLVTVDKNVPEGSKVS